MDINKDLLTETSDNTTKPQPCSSYDTETGKCKTSNKYCDTCYNESLTMDI